MEDRPHRGMREDRDSNPRTGRTGTGEGRAGRRTRERDRDREDRSQRGKERGGDDVSRMGHRGRSKARKASKDKEREKHRTGGGVTPGGKNFRQKGKAQGGHLDASFVFNVTSSRSATPAEGRERERDPRQVFQMQMENSFNHACHPYVSKSKHKKKAQYYRGFFNKRF